MSEYDIDFITSAGSYALQILREDHGGATGYDILADAVRVPEPASLSLLGMGLLSLGMIRRRRKSA